MFMVDEVSSATGVEATEFPGFDAAGWGSFETWFSAKQFQFLSHIVDKVCGPQC